jgi:hypothetical protein
MPTTSTSTTFGAFVDNEFTKGYVLDEERIRKLNEILVTRGGQIHPDCKPTFKIYKADTFSYTTDDVQKVLSENNADWEKIERLTIFMKHDDDFYLNLDFGNETTKLHIEGKERDVVFLIFSELKQYIGNEIAIIKPFIGTKSKSFMSAVSSIFFVLIFSVYMFSSDVFKNTATISKAEALNSQDIQIKLNFLIEKQSDPSSLRTFPFVMIGAMILTFLPLFGGEFLLRPIKYLFPNRVFLIGKEIEKHAKRLTLRQNLLWVVIIGSAISIGTGLIVWFITK